MSKSRRNRAIDNALHKRMAKQYYENFIISGIMTYKEALLIGFLPREFTPILASNAFRKITYQLNSSWRK